MKRKLKYLILLISLIGILQQSKAQITIPTPFTVSLVAPPSSVPLTGNQTVTNVSVSANNYSYPSAAGGDGYTVSNNSFASGVAFVIMADMSITHTGSAGKIGVGTGTSSDDNPLAYITFFVSSSGVGHAFASNFSNFYGDSDISLTSAQVRIRGDGTNIYAEVNYNGAGWTLITGWPTVPQGASALFGKQQFDTGVVGSVTSNVLVNPDIN